MYTKQKIKQRDVFISENSPEFKRKKTLSEMKKSKNIHLKKQYEKIAKNTSREHNERKNVQMEAAKIVDKNIRRIYRKKSFEHEASNGLLMTERCKKFI